MSDEENQNSEMNDDEEEMEEEGEEEMDEDGESENSEMGIDGPNDKKPTMTTPSIKKQESISKLHR